MLVSHNDICMMCTLLNIHEKNAQRDEKGLVYICRFSRSLWCASLLYSSSQLSASESFHQLFLNRTKLWKTSSFIFSSVAKPCYVTRFEHKTAAAGLDGTGWPSTSPQGSVIARVQEWQYFISVLWQVQSVSLLPYPINQSKTRRTSWLSVMNGTPSVYQLNPIIQSLSSF